MVTNWMMFKEAIATTALEHADDCDCRVCRAAHGDKEALFDLMMDWMGRR